jgi:hypothetical protein
MYCSVAEKGMKVMREFECVMEGVWLCGVQNGILKAQTISTTVVLTTLWALVKTFAFLAVNNLT